MAVVNNQLTGAPYGLTGEQVAAGASGVVGATSAGAAVIGGVAFSPSGVRPGGKVRVMIFGSSNAAGTAATGLNSWASLLATALTATHDFVNVSVGGRSLSQWVNEDANGVAVTSSTLSRLEAAILTHRPHVVICGATAQNDIDTANQSASYLEGFVKTWVSNLQKAIGICQRLGARTVVVTPYNSVAYTALNRDYNFFLGEHLCRLGVDIIDFASVFGFSGTTPPATIDSGDGLHLNDAGHAAQYRTIPQEYLWPKWEKRVPGRISLPVVDAGFLVPADTTTGSPLLTSAFPPGSWAIGFHVKAPGTFFTSALISLVGSTATWRIRNPSGTGAYVFTPGPDPDMTIGTLTAGAESRIDITYNEVTRQVTTYFNGIQAAQATASASPGTVTGLCVGGRHDIPSLNAVGFRYRNLTLHATCLQQQDIRRTLIGDVSPRSLVGAWALDDAPTRPAGAGVAQHGSLAMSARINVATA